MLLVHRSGRPPSYAFPESDVHGLPAQPEPDTPGYVTVAWTAADSWFEEAEEVFGHPRNPYHRIDCLRSERRLVVEAGGEILVDTTETLVVYETSLAPRLYVDPRHVRMDLLERSTTETYCPYKGTATYWSARLGDDVLADVAWSYEDPLPESAPARRALELPRFRASRFATTCLPETETSEFFRMCSSRPGPWSTLIDGRSVREPALRPARGGWTCGQSPAVTTPIHHLAGLMPRRGRTLRRVEGLRSFRLLDLWCGYGPAPP